MSGKRRWGRRDVLRTSGGAIAGAATAGCLGSDEDGGDGGLDDDGDTDGNGTDANTAGSNGTTETDDTDEDDEEPSADGSYTVSMPPVGEVEFESVPQTWAAGTADWADMGVALGREPPAALYLAQRYHTGYYDDVPGVSVDPNGIDSLWVDGLAHEEVMNLAEEVDLFVMDPTFLTERANWSHDDIERIETTGTPFFGNTIFSRSYSWHLDYDHLTMYEAFERLAAVFQEQERYEAFASLHDEFQSELEAVVPAGDRPEVAVLYPQLVDNSFLPFRIDGGTSYKHLRDLEVEDALADMGSDTVPDRIDYETLLEIDPEHILLRTERYFTEEEFRQHVVEPMRNHDVGRELTAVRNDDVYKTLPFYQGPIINLVATQRLAQQLYDVEDDLFDPQDVSDIVNGDF